MQKIRREECRNSMGRGVYRLPDCCLGQPVEKLSLQSKCDQLGNFTVDSEFLYIFHVIKNWCWTATRKLQFNVAELSLKIHVFYVVLVLQFSIR